ncbi:DUF2946 family protein [Comamonas sp. 4034]|uniref:DUF2946 family protein n=1 Tax=Comamonas sp. 4034 TaxID=3156455 RepID=UPI003D21B1A2
MDDIVKQAMTKWPNVPACYGWLGLDARGNWWLRDAAAQAAGSFASGVPGAKGSRVEHVKLAEFIARNYLHDARGCWYFQNGPQQVFVELEATPWIWRVQMQAREIRIHSHTGSELAPAEVQKVLVDEDGAVYMAVSMGLGMVHTQDVLDVSAALDAGLLPAPEEVRRNALPHCYGFISSPAQLASTGS